MKIKLRDLVKEQTSRPFVCIWFYCFNSSVG